MIQIKLKEEFIVDYISIGVIFDVSTKVNLFFQFNQHRFFHEFYLEQVTQKVEQRRNYHIWLIYTCRGIPQILNFLINSNLDWISDETH